MAWHERKTEDMREEFVKRVLSGEKTKTALCQEYGISRPTGDKWIQRYLDGEPLTDQSRSPIHIANRTSDAMEEIVLSYRKRFPVFGAAKLRRIMCNEGVENAPCARTINNILNRHGMITREASLAATPNIRYCKSYPNEMWQGDYKGHFALGNSVRCHPLNIIDDFSRYNLCSEALQNETFEEMKPVMIRLFREYGMPFSFLCDNGNPWGTSQSLGFTSFEVWMMSLGILVLHGRPIHPQTQGKEERYNGSFTRECLRQNTFEDMDDAQRKFNTYREMYNNVRPHHALKLEVPSSVYQKSERVYPEKIEPWEYGKEYEVRKIKDSGFFTFQNQGYFLSEAFRGQTVGIRESRLPGQFTIEFRNFKIARIDPEKRVFTQKRAYLIEGDPRTPSAPSSTVERTCQG